jgi:hypothetical protein
MPVCCIVGRFTNSERECCLSGPYYNVLEKSVNIPEGIETTVGIW